MKSEVRKRVKAAVAQIPSSEREIRSAGIWKQVESDTSFRSARTVLAYYSIAGEPDTHSVLEKWHSMGKRVALPVVVGEYLILKEYDPRKMVQGAFNIMEPSVDAGQINPSEIDFAVIPGVAFDAAGNRLGHGKGYYDRLLPELSCVKCGVAFAEAVVDELPCEAWDCPMDLVIRG